MGKNYWLTPFISLWLFATGSQAQVVDSPKKPSNAEQIRQNRLKELRQAMIDEHKKSMDEYIPLLSNSIKKNIVFDPSRVNGNPASVVSVEIDNDGVIVDAKVIKSSGNADWDNAVLQGIMKTQKFPQMPDGRIPLLPFTKVVTFNFVPKEN